jgi:hypothetical protein
MVTRAERLGHFVTDADPPFGSVSEDLCEDHVGTDVRCCSRAGVPVQEYGRGPAERTGELIEGRVIGWRGALTFLYPVRHLRRDPQAVDRR